MSNKWELQTHQVNAYCYYQNIFDEDMIDSIIKTGDNLEIGDAYVGGDLQKSGAVDESIRRTKVSWIHGTAENAWLFRKLTDVIQAANQQWFGFDLTTIEALQYSVYHETGFYDQATQ